MRAQLVEGCIHLLGVLVPGLRVPSADRIGLSRGMLGKRLHEFLKGHFRAPQIPLRIFSMACNPNWRWAP